VRTESCRYRAKREPLRRVEALLPESKDRNHGERCEDRVLDGPASGEKGSKGGPYMYCNPRTRARPGPGPHTHRPSGSWRRASCRSTPRRDGPASGWTGPPRDSCRSTRLRDGPASGWTGPPRDSCRSTRHPFTTAPREPASGQTGPARDSHLGTGPPQDGQARFGAPGRDYFRVGPPLGDNRARLRTDRLWMGPPRGRRARLGTVCLRRPGRGRRRGGRAGMLSASPHESTLGALFLRGGPVQDPVLTVSVSLSLKERNGSLSHERESHTGVPRS